MKNYGITLTRGNYTTSGRQRILGKEVEVEGKRLNCRPKFISPLNTENFLKKICKPEIFNLEYSRGSKSEHVRILDGQACSVHNPDHSNSERKKWRLAWTVLYETFFISLHTKRSRLTAKNDGHLVRFFEKNWRH